MGGEPQTYAEIAKNTCNAVGTIASRAQRAHWQLLRIIRERVAREEGPLDSEELEDLQQRANNCPPTSFGRGIEFSLVKRGFLRETSKDVELTELGEYVAHVSLTNPFKPYRCKCYGARTTCPLCGTHYHTHTRSPNNLPAQCEVCAGALASANDQGIHWIP